MKNYLKKIIYFFTLTAFFVSCNQEEEVNYIPKVNEQVPAFTVATSNVTDNSFNVDYTSPIDGVLFYAIQLSSATAPSAESIISRSSGSLVNAKKDLTSGANWSYTMTTGIYGNYDYSIYSVLTNADGIASAVNKVNVKTPDTADPMFLRSSSSPAFQSGGVNPFAPVTFTFSEPVFYQGGDITFTANASGRVITVNSASVLSASGASITVNTHGTFEQDDFQIVNWADGTFKDNSGKNVSALTGFSHYFKTRFFTAPEAAALMVGNYNYATVFYGDNIANVYNNNAPFLLPATGQFELKLDPSDASGTTLLGINLFNAFDGEPENLKIKFGADGELAILDAPQPMSIYNVPTHWTHYSASLVTALPGFYDVTNGTINHYLSVAVSATNQAFSDLDYNYSRIGTYAKSTPELQERLKNRNEILKQNRAYKKVDFKTNVLIK